MGQIFNCDRCDSTYGTRAVTFSEDLVLKLADGIDPKPEKIEKGQSRDVSDRAWREKITCIDKSHSAIYGLDEETFKQLMNQLERKLQDTEDTSISISGRREMIECYIKNRENELCCAEVTKDYADSVDLHRLEKMKKY